MQDSEHQPSDVHSLESSSKPAAAPLTIERALQFAFSLGRTYWQQADSDSYSQNKRSDATRGRFLDLVAQMVAAEAARQAPAQTIAQPDVQGDAK